MITTLGNRLHGLKHRGFSPIVRILSIALLILIFIGFYSAYKAIWPTPYIANQAGFQIVFPGTPTVDKLPSQTKSGIKESGSIYNVENQAKDTDYAVYVTKYTSINFSSMSKTSKLNTLDDELEALSNNENAKLSNGQSLTFEGLTAVKATLTPNDTSEASTKALAFLNKSRLYVIFGTGINQSKFNSFTRSFHFRD